MKASLFDLTSPEETVTFLGKRQRVLAGVSTVKLLARNQGDQQPVRAGLAVYKDELRFLDVSYDFAQQKIILNAQNTVRKYMLKVEEKVDSAEDVLLRVSYTEEAYNFFFKTESESSWTLLGHVDTLELTGFDFTGPLIGMFAVGPDVIVEFKDFKIDVLDS